LEKEVNDMIDEAKKKGVTGVPLVIIDGKWAVAGAQSSEVFIQVMFCFTRLRC
jgi:predicted DsbA family dithiol-disulfide isomerase